MPFIQIPTVQIHLGEFDSVAGGYRTKLRCSDGSSKSGFLSKNRQPEVEGEPILKVGIALFSWLMFDAGLASYWAEIRGRYPRRRIQLHIDQKSDLHRLPWESLRESTEDAGQVALGEQEATPFSRYWEGRSPGPIEQAPVRVLAAIADPVGLDGMQLHQVNRQQEWEALQESIKGMEDARIKMDLLAGPCTLKAIGLKLRSGDGYHILHFIGHGFWFEGHASLLLADGNNKCKPETEGNVAEMMRNLLGDGSFGNPLRLVYLSSCETASLSGSSGMATQLLLAGVPTVLAMQGKVLVKTAREFSRIFYRELLSHGEADRACNRARAILRTTANSGAELPVFLSRLLDGRMIAEPETQVNLEDLQRFLLKHFDAAALDSIGAELGVDLSALKADAALRARQLIRELETENRLDALVAETIGAGSDRGGELRRLPLGEELLELFRKNSSKRGDGAKLNRLLEALKNGRLPEEKAASVIASFQKVLLGIVSMGGSTDGSDLPGISERVLRFLGKAGGKATYQLTVVAPMIPVVMSAREATNLAALELKTLQRHWAELGQAPAWMRPKLVASAGGLALVLGLVVAEIGWRWPLRIWPNESPIWMEDFSNPKLPAWICGSGGSERKSCAEYGRPREAGEKGEEGERERRAGMELPRGIVADRVLEANNSHYDFGFRFRFQFSENSRLMRFYLRKVGGSGYLFTLERKESGNGTKVKLKSEFCEAKQCIPIGEEVVKQHSCALLENSDFMVNGLAEGNQFHIRVGANAHCKASMELEHTWQDKNRWGPRRLYGGLALGDSDGTIMLLQEVTVFNLVDGRENMGIQTQ